MGAALAGEFAAARFRRTAAKGHAHQPSDITDSTAAGRGLLTATDAAAQRTALGLGNAAAKDVGTAAGTVAAGDHSHAAMPLAHSTLTYAASIAVDFNGDPYKSLTLTGDVTLTTTNRAALRMVTVRIVGDSGLGRPRRFGESLGIGGWNGTGIGEGTE
jgi:hypothetical protein